MNHIGKILFHIEYISLKKILLSKKFIKNSLATTSKLKKYKITKKKLLMFKKNNNPFEFYQCPILDIMNVSIVDKKVVRDVKFHTMI